MTVTQEEPHPYVVELLFDGLGLVPRVRNAKVTEAAIHWNYTSILNLAALLVTAGLIYRLVRTGGVPMLKMMGGTPDNEDDQSEHHHGIHAS